LSKSVREKYDYFEQLKTSYRQRIQELDNFSKRFSNNSAGYRSEFLTILLDLSQHYVDLQKKFMVRYPKWYDDNLMTKNSKVITEMWVQAFRNMDSFYSEFLDYASQSLREVNKIGMQMLQTLERYYDLYEDIPQFQRETLVELIKEAKQYNDKYVKDSLQKAPNQSQKTKPKKEPLVKGTT
jgi:hypothetical protein